MIDKFKFKISDYILYLLQRIEPKQSGKLKLNKIAFFVEFGYFHKTGNELSFAKYAGINLGPVINDYKLLLDKMKKDGQIIIDGNCIRPLRSPNVSIPEDIARIIDPLIEKYSRLSESELVKLSHSTDSYLITTQNEKRMGNIINKNLAMLESFYDEEICEDEIDANRLPRVDKKELVPYEI